MNNLEQIRMNVQEGLENNEDITYLLGVVETLNEKIDRLYSELNEWEEE
ncbi:MAG: hypothetical protein GY941_22230 [Planctomycetes bacterium]|nr:hypothetical protein [Planctomycetota bacterium]